MLQVHEASKFLGFVTMELIPVVEKDYKSSVRILNGHSFCGAFTIYALVYKPGYFNYYIATSPTPIMKLINKNDYQRIDSLSERKIGFYFSFGSKDMGQVRRWALRLKDNMD
jgi:predicted alpha/beta superfamily hydrolase